MTAADLERRFLAGLNDAQDAYMEIVATRAWVELGHDSFSAWWDSAVRPVMRSLSMKPTREIAAAVIEQVREEEAELPPAQRRTQRELGEMVGVSQPSVSRSVSDSNEYQADLEARNEVAAAIAQHLPPDDPWRPWRASFLADIHAAYRLMSRQTVDEVTDRADETCMAEFDRLITEIARYGEQVRRARAATYGGNVVAFRSAH